MKNKKTIIGVCIVFLFAIFACAPLFGKGYIPTHDGEYHIIRFIEFFRMISQGYWFPRWAPTLNSGYGIPIFLFHYPFPNYIGALIQKIGFHAVDAFKLSLACGYITAGLFSFLWLKKLFGVKAATTGTIVSMYVPYWFVDIYVRGSVGEVWAIAGIFAALYFSEASSTILLSFVIAGLILSHNILAMIFIPFLLGYIILRNYRMLTGILYGILLSSYFWIPAILERKYVVGLNTVSFQEHFTRIYELIIPSWGTELSGQMFVGNKMSFQIGIITILVLIASLVCAIRDKDKPKKKLYVYFFLTFLGSVLLTVSWSQAVWHYLKVLQFVQYPWRFLSFLIPLIGFMAAYASGCIRMRIFSIVLILVAVAFSYSYARPVIYAPRDSAYYLARRNFTDGTSSMGNSFSTIWTGWKTKRPDYVINIRNGQIKNNFSKNLFLNKEFIIFSELGAHVYMPILYFPGWNVYMDNNQIPIQFELDGTIQFSVPSGDHRIRVFFSETTQRRYADMLSVLTLVWLVGWGILGVYADRNKHLSNNKRTR